MSPARHQGVAAFADLTRVVISPLTRPSSQRILRPEAGLWFHRLERRNEMGGALEAATRQLFDSLDRIDAQSIIPAATEDVQGDHEINRRCTRAILELVASTRQLVKMVGDVDTAISDVNETVLGATALMTCSIEQDYTLE